jgi:hypothetical protein
VRRIKLSLNAVLENLALENLVRVVLNNKSITYLANNSRSPLLLDLLDKDRSRTDQRNQTVINFIDNFARGTNDKLSEGEKSPAPIAVQSIGSSASASSDAGRTRSQGERGTRSRSRSRSRGKNEPATVPSQSLTHYPERDTSRPPGRFRGDNALTTGPATVSTKKGSHIPGFDSPVSAKVRSSMQQLAAQSRVRYPDPSGATYAEVRNLLNGKTIYILVLDQKPRNVKLTDEINTMALVGENGKSISSPAVILFLVKTDPQACAIWKARKLEGGTASLKWGNLVYCQKGCTHLTICPAQQAYITAVVYDVLLLQASTPDRPVQSSRRQFLLYLESDFVDEGQKNKLLEEFVQQVKSLRDAPPVVPPQAPQASVGPSNRARSSASAPFATAAATVPRLSSSTDSNMTSGVAPGKRRADSPEVFAAMPKTRRTSSVGGFGPQPSGNSS